MRNGVLDATDLTRFAVNMSYQLVILDLNLSYFNVRNVTYCIARISKLLADR